MRTQLILFEAKLYQQIHIITYLKQGISQVYVMVDFIYIDRVELWGKKRKHELQNEDVCPQWDLIPLPQDY